MHEAEIIAAGLVGGGTAAGLVLLGMMLGAGLQALAKLALRRWRRRRWNRGETVPSRVTAEAVGGSVLMQSDNWANWRSPASAAKLAADLMDAATTALNATDRVQS